jgi:hypothetical protein
MQIAKKDHPDRPGSDDGEGNKQGSDDWAARTRAQLQAHEARSEEQSGNRRRRGEHGERKYRYTPEAHNNERGTMRRTEPSHRRDRQTDERQDNPDKCWNREVSAPTH